MHNRPGAEIDSRPFPHEPKSLVRLVLAFDQDQGSAPTQTCGLGSVRTPSPYWSLLQPLGVFPVSTSLLL